jgi:glucose-6-phosphate isomerase
MIKIDYSFMMEEFSGKNGISPSGLDKVEGKALEALAAVKSKKLPDMDFLDLPGQGVPAEVSEIGARIRREAGDFILLGIGGSALGPKCILEALSPFHNLSGKKPGVFIYDNVDPSTLQSILEKVDVKKTFVNVISKSGGTAETAAAFMVLYEKMERAGAAGRLVITTDPRKGDLRKLSAELGVPSLPVPPGVGGRYSVLSPVGLLPAEVAGVDSRELLKGAADIKEKCMKGSLKENPALLYGSLLYLMGTEKSLTIDVMMPYSDRLRAFSEWFCQLWSESLGKQGRGFTPYPSVGSTDQHSQLQLWMEGPEDKVVTFLRVDYGSDFKIPDVFGDKESMAYLKGHRLSELIKAEQEATALALARAGRPNLEISVPRVDAYHLGQLFYFFEFVTSVAGFLLGINPFNQPSVEESKRFTFGMLGRPGYEEKKKEVQQVRDNKTFRF